MLKAKDEAIIMPRSIHTFVNKIVNTLKCEVIYVLSLRAWACAPVHLYVCGVGEGVAGGGGHEVAEAEEGGTGPARGGQRGQPRSLH